MDTDTDTDPDDWDQDAMQLLAETAFDLRRLRMQLSERVILAWQEGNTWQEIADALGMTRQSAHERFRSLVDGTDHPTHDGQWISEGGRWHDVSLPGFE
jgi:hypothetical protein